MWSTIYIYLPDQAEWEDMSLFLTLESAYHYAASHLLKYLDKKHPWSEVSRYRIETFRAKPANAFHLTPTYESHRIRDLTVDEVVALQHAVAEHTDLSRFFT